MFGRKKYNEYKIGEKSKLFAEQLLVNGYGMKENIDEKGFIYFTNVLEIPDTQLNTLITVYFYPDETVIGYKFDSFAFIDDEDRLRAINYLNELNIQYELCYFYVDENNMIILSFQIDVRETYSPKAIVGQLRRMIQVAELEFPKFFNEEPIASIVPNYDND